MSTAMFNHHRRYLTPSKRKERESYDVLKPPSRMAKPGVSGSGSAKPADPAHNNQLLAGYLAHEYLSKGTLLGQPWDPARSGYGSGSGSGSGPTDSGKAEAKVEKYRSYVEVADLLKKDGAQIPGIINPTQLARFLQL